jgi:benzoyl-CoA reductase/2-hydroxyglutaryl-CoA dehydratase subunit BcrC/BadD/HgdB
VERDYDLVDWIERAGGRIVLNATEWGERTLPRPFHRARVRNGPFEELADAYFAIPDVFRRPNDSCHEYLRREMTARQVRGVVFRRYVWCDLWHAELARLKAWSPVPVLDLDVGQSESSAEGRTVGRIEAFLETLREGSGFGVQGSGFRFEARPERRHQRQTSIAEPRTPNPEP